MSKRERRHLTSKTVEGSALTLESVDDVHGSDGFPLGVLGVGDCVTDNVLQKDLQDTTSFLVDKSRNTLDSTTTSETTDGGFGDTLDVITQHFPVTLGAPLSEPFASFTTTSRC